MTVLSNLFESFCYGNGVSLVEFPMKNGWRSNKNQNIYTILPNLSHCYKLRIIFMNSFSSISKHLKRAYELTFTEKTMFYCLYSSIRLSIFLEHWKLSGFDSFQLCWLETVLCMLISLRTTLNSPKTISIFRKIYHVISDSQMNCELLFKEHKVLWYEHFIIEQFVYISHKSWE